MHSIIPLVLHWLSIVGRLAHAQQRHHRPLRAEQEEHTMARDVSDECSAPG
jgi:hypothetical protein